MHLAGCFFNHDQYLKLSLVADKIHVCHLNQVEPHIHCMLCLLECFKNRVVLFCYGKWVVIATFINKIVEYQVIPKEFTFFFVNLGGGYNEHYVKTLENPRKTPRLSYPESRLDNSSLSK